MHVFKPVYCLDTMNRCETDTHCGQIRFFIASTKADVYVQGSPADPWLQGEGEIPPLTHADP